MSDLLYKQPFEGIIAADLPSASILALDDVSLAHRRNLLILAQGFKNAVSVGNPAPVVKKLQDRMYRPSPGDWVMEMGTRHAIDRGNEGFRGTGILLEVRREWMDSDEEWNELLASGEYNLVDDERPHQKVWYIQYGPRGGVAPTADICRWTNADFFAIPVESDWS